MAVSPVLLNKLPFDAELEHKIQFTYSGAQIFAHRLIIKNNLTNETVYDEKTSSMGLFAKVPAGTLTNGLTYNFQLSVFDSNDTESSLSNIIILLALKTPEFRLENVTEAMVVRNSYLDVSIFYSQVNGELLDEYVVTLYGSDKTTIAYTSNIQYADNLTVRIPELMDDTTYYLRATGSTVNGIEMDTGLVVFSCDYIKPDVFLKFRADNVPEEGTVRLSSNFIMVEGRTDADPLVFIDGEKVSLLDGETVIFDNNFQADNFVCELIVSDIPDFSTILTINQQTTILPLTWNFGYFSESDDKLYYAEIAPYSYVGNEPLRYIQTSNRIPALAKGQQVFIWLRHVDGMYDLKIEVLPLESTEELIVEGGDE